MAEKIDTTDLEEDASEILTDREVGMLCKICKRLRKKGIYHLYKSRDAGIYVSGCKRHRQKFIDKFNELPDENFKEVNKTYIVK